MLSKTINNHFSTVFIIVRGVGRDRILQDPCHFPRAYHMLIAAFLSVIASSAIFCLLEYSFAPLYTTPSFLTRTQYLHDRYTARMGWFWADATTAQTAAPHPLASQSDGRPPVCSLFILYHCIAQANMSSHHVQCTTNSHLPSSFHQRSTQRMSSQTL